MAPPPSRPNCPVSPDQLRYLTMSFRGFDARAHTGGDRFESAGWTWGGRWSDPVDFMHFSANGH